MKQLEFILGSDHTKTKHKVVSCNWDKFGEISYITVDLNGKTIPFFKSIGTKNWFIRDTQTGYIVNNN